MADDRKLLELVTAWRDDAFAWALQGNKLVAATLDYCAAELLDTVLGREEEREKAPRRRATTNRRMVVDG